MHCRVRTGSALVLALLVGITSQLASQIPEIAMRGPRFLAVSPKGGQPVDASRASVFQRRVSFQVANVTARAALEAMSREADLRFVYSDDLVRLDRKVSLEAKNLTVAAVLREILIGTGLDVLVLSDGQLGLVRKAQGPVQGGVAGRVTDGKTGEGIRSADGFL
jgi:hypothetical protein